MRRHFVLFLFVLIGELSNSPASVLTLTPEPTLWTSVEHVSLQVRCYLDPKAIDVTEEDTKAVIRVYVRNDSDHTLQYISSARDHGLIFRAMDPSKSNFKFREFSPDVSISRIPIEPGAVLTYTLPMGVRESKTFRALRMSAEALISDPKNQSLIRVIAPVVSR